MTSEKAHQKGDGQPFRCHQVTEVKDQTGLSDWGGKEKRGPEKHPKEHPTYKYFRPHYHNQEK